MIPKKKLTPKENLWVDFYCSNGGNQTQAAISAGYSEKSARNIGMRLMTKAHILEAIKERQKPIAEKHKITRESLIAEIEEAQQMARDLGKPEVFIKGAEVKAKMLGLNEPEKIELSGGIEQKIKVNVAFK